MDSLCVVVEFNVLEYLLVSLFVAVITGILNKLSFQSSIKRFHDGIIIWITFAAHALPKTIAHQ